MTKGWRSWTKSLTTWRNKLQTYFGLFSSAAKPISKLANRSFVRGSNKITLSDSAIMIFVAVVFLTFVVGYRFHNQPQLTEGKTAPITIRAPETASFEDTKTTQEKRKVIQTAIVPRLKQDEQTTKRIYNRLNKHLKQIDELRAVTKPFPSVDLSALSLDTQQYLRTITPTEFDQTLNFALENKLNLGQQKAIAEITAYRQKVTPEAFSATAEKLETAHHRYHQAQQKLQNEIAEPEATLLLGLDDPTWYETKQRLILATERILTQGIAPGIPQSMLEQTVNLQLGSNLSPEVVLWAQNTLLGLLQPNLQEDSEATLSYAEKAVDAIEPVVVSINEGEVIVREGATIDRKAFVLLDGFGLSRRSINWWGIQVTVALVTLAIAIFIFCQQQTYVSLRHRDYFLLCLLALSAPIFSILQVPYTNLPALGLLVSSFYSPLLAVSYMSLLSGLIFFSNPLLAWEYLFAGISGGLIAAAFAGRLRSREAISKLGVTVGLVQGGIYFIAKLVLSSSAGTIWSAVLPDSILYGLSGVAWFIIALGISPYIERLFDLITPIRLAELSNPNLPLLKRLATEAPGTFQHTMFVASLAEAAARTLNCNVELVRAGTLYHDIGKMHDPLGFIENQMGGSNKHDHLNDPWASADIIKKHVSQGLVMAKKYGLPKAIRDFIPEHQGTLLIAYFYHQAKQKVTEDSSLELLESDFRYEGPVPQSREAGIMMLADGCEAALRSLKDATPEQALSTVKKIFKARWQDRQLCDSGLRYEELPIIAEVFIRVWQQFNHQRIAYPKDIK